MITHSDDAWLKPFLDQRLKLIRDSEAITRDTHSGNKKSHLTSTSKDVIIQSLSFSQHPPQIYLRAITVVINCCVSCPILLIAVYLSLFNNYYELITLLVLFVVPILFRSRKMQRSQNVRTGMIKARIYYTKVFKMIEAAK